MIRKLYSQPDLVLVGAMGEREEIRHTDAMDRGMVHFCFCVEGCAEFSFSPNYTRQLKAGHSQLIYNPEEDLFFSMTAPPRSRVVFLTISLEYLHTLFVDDTIYFLNLENINHKSYDERSIPAALTAALNQLLAVDLDEKAACKLYRQGKALEILGLYFSRKKADTESCPFLNDTEVARKIKHAKEHLIAHERNPPTIRELARVVGLNEYQLKVGFKHTYGNTIFGFLLDRKLDISHGLLASGKHKVGEVGYLVGYANISHFISAFKRRFGVTPKKYLASHQGR